MIHSRMSLARWFEREPSQGGHPVIRGFGFLNAPETVIRPGNDPISILYCGVQRTAWPQGLSQGRLVGSFRYLWGHRG